MSGRGRCWGDELGLTEGTWGPKRGLRAALVGDGERRSEGISAFLQGGPPGTSVRLEWRPGGQLRSATSRQEMLTIQTQGLPARTDGGETGRKR